MKKLQEPSRPTRMKKINSLYVHIPFCESICDYCDFPKLQYFRIFAEKYLKVLEQELKDRQVSYDLKTIYVGGGTPTALEDDLFFRLLEILKPFSKDVEEYTFEANPESLSLAKLEMMKKYGVNRISLGVQSTDDKILKAINRHHSFIDVKNAVNNIKKVGIDNFNVDLILGLPHVSKIMLKKDLDNILMLEPKHISTYSLTVHPHTMFYIKNIEEVDDDMARELYDFVHEYLTSNGYNHYEVSNFALTNFESIHNKTYWRNEEYYGVGLGAAGYIDDIRYKNTTNLDKYLKSEYEDEVEVVDLTDKREYQIMLNLRTKEGINLISFKNEYKEDLYSANKTAIDEMIKSGLLIMENNHLKPTYEGMMILDQIILKLLIK